MIWIPFAGAISEATIFLLEKKVLRKRKIDFKAFTILAFFAAVIFSIPLLFFFWKITPQAFETKNLLILAFIVLASVFANLLVFYAIKWEKITEIEPIRLFQPLFVILLAFIIYSSERTTSVLIPALIASLALVFSHVKKHHIKFNKFLIAAFFGSFFYAVELVASKAILPYYSIFTFYFIRCFLILIITLAIFKFSSEKIDNKSKFLIFIIGALWVFYRIILYYGYVTYGVVFTTLLFILAPVFIYLFAKIFLKEKLTLRNIIATAVIVACVAYAVWVGG